LWLLVEILSPPPDIIKSRMLGKGTQKQVELITSNLVYLSVIMV